MLNEQSEVVWIGVSPGVPSLSAASNVLQRDMDYNSLQEQAEMADWSPSEEAADEESYRG